MNRYRINGGPWLNFNRGLRTHTDLSTFIHWCCFDGKRKTNLGLNASTASIHPNLGDIVEIRTHDRFTYTYKCVGRSVIIGECYWDLEPVTNMEIINTLCQKDK